MDFITYMECQCDGNNSSGGMFWFLENIYKKKQNSILGDNCRWQHYQTPKCNKLSVPNEAK